MERDGSPVVSIIIPVYNAGEYLAETLHSVRSQTYRNLEIILVDDGSTDGSGEYCDCLKEKDCRIKVFHKENGGAAEARNDALERVNGDYVAFIDSDDLVKPDYIENMARVAEKWNAQLVVCRWLSGAKYSPEEFYQYKTSKMPSNVYVDLNQYTWTGEFRHPIAWAALYSAPLAKGISFSRDLYVGEDTLYFAKALKNAGGLVYIDEQYYYHRYHIDSITGKKYQLKHATEITSWERVKDLFSEQSESFRNECECAIALRCKKNYLNAKESCFEDENLYRELYNKAKQRYRNVLRSPEINFKGKILLSVFLLFPNTYAAYHVGKSKSL